MPLRLERYGIIIVTITTFLLVLVSEGKKFLAKADKIYVCKKKNKKKGMGWGVGVGGCLGVGGGGGGGGE